MIRQLMAAFFPEAEEKKARSQPCTKDGCPTGVHYHWGYGQRHTSKTPETGPNSFSDGRPFFKE